MACPSLGRRRLGRGMAVPDVGFPSPGVGHRAAYTPLPCRKQRDRSHLPTLPYASLPCRTRHYPAEIMYSYLPGGFRARGSARPCTRCYPAGSFLLERGPTLPTSLDRYNCLPRRTARHDYRAALAVPRPTLPTPRPSDPPSASRQLRLPDQITASRSAADKRRRNGWAFQPPP